VRAISLSTWGPAFLRISLAAEEPWVLDEDRRTRPTTPYSERPARPTQAGRRQKGP